MSDKITKLIRVAISTAEDGEALAALGRLRVVLKSEDVSPSEVHLLLSEPEPAHDPKEEIYEQARWTKMPFGKYKGRSVYSVWMEDSDYILLMLKECESIKPGIRRICEALAACYFNLRKWLT